MPLLPFVMSMKPRIKWSWCFLALLQAYDGQGRRVSPNSVSNYAPAMFASDDAAEGVTSKAFARAMTKLLKESRLVLPTLPNALPTGVAPPYNPPWALVAPPVGRQANAPLESPFPLAGPPAGGLRLSWRASASRLTSPVRLAPDVEWRAWDPLESTCRHASLSIL